MPLAIGWFVSGGLLGVLYLIAFITAGVMTIRNTREVSPASTTDTSRYRFEDRRRSAAQLFLLMFPARSDAVTQNFHGPALARGARHLTK